MSTGPSGNFAASDSNVSRKTALERTGSLPLVYAKVLSNVFRDRLNVAGRVVQFSLLLLNCYSFQYVTAMGRMRLRD
jgi:hypothetical protein